VGSRRPVGRIRPAYLLRSQFANALFERSIEIKNRLERDLNHVPLVQTVVQPVARKGIRIVNLDQYVAQAVP
jgi:hypothetical protein